VSCIERPTSGERDRAQVQAGSIEKGAMVKTAALNTLIVYAAFCVAFIDAVLLRSRGL
jgi:hypothetical protein